MALKVGELEADLTLTDSKFEKGMGGAKSKFDGFAKGLAQDAEKSGNKAGSSLSDGLGKGMGGAKSKFGGLAKDLAQEAQTGGNKAGSALGDGLSDGLGKGLSKGSDKFGRFTKDLEQKAGAGGSKAGSSLSDGVGKGLSAMKGLPALAAGSAIGIAVVKGFTDAMAVEDATALLSARLGLTEQQAAKSGKIAGDLYKGAWGDSVADIDDVLATVFQNGLAKVTDGADAIKGVTTEVMNFAKISKEEALPVTRAVAQMLKTGLAKNATDAFDILTRGQQLGINKSEDLLDTFTEYGTQFRKLGLDGKDALGLINQMLQGGARDADTAADAVKEFSIRAVDGSKTSAAGYKALGLDAAKMTAEIAKGGPAAKTAFGKVLDGLNGIKDPVKREAAGVALFGTKWEDLGAAIGKADLDTAAGSLGKVGGAAKAAGDTLNDTTSSKLTSFWRTLKMAVVDGIGKYALPKLEAFGDWFAGPGRFVLVSWALSSGAAILDLADKMLGGISGMIGGLAKFGKVAMIAAAGVVAMTNPAQALQMLKNADALGKWADEAKVGIGNARTELQGWKSTLDKTNLKVKLQADIADLESKLATAKKKLADPKLTATQKAQLKADIANLERNIDTAKGKLGQPALVATKTAKLEATKKDLDSKIAAAKQALADPKLSATKKAQLRAEIAQLLAAKKKAQDAINALKGKTIDIVTRYKTIIAGQPPPDPTLGGLFPGKAGGGRVAKGQPYVVGEHRPELFVPDEDGNILPRVPSSAGAAGGSGGAAAAPVVLDLSDQALNLSDTTIRALGKVFAGALREGKFRLVNSGGGGAYVLQMSNG